MNRKPISQARVRELLNYDPATGIFTWKPRRGCQTDKPLGCCNGFGYLRIAVDGRLEYAHRLAWIFMHGDIPADRHIDHINGSRSDNRIANLRPATPSQNGQNRHGAQRNSKSGILGVSWHARAKKWQAHRNSKYLGVFATQADAIAAWEAA
jgi:hypothetical protein